MAHSGERAGARGSMRLTPSRCNVVAVGRWDLATDQRKYVSRFGNAAVIDGQGSES